MSETEDLDALLAEITAVRVGMALEPMAELLELGEDAVAPIAAAFERCKDDEDADSLWLLVLLGEMRSARAIATLAPLLAIEGMPTEHALAAGEALAKIGTPAIPALVAASQSERRTERILAYGALGAIADSAAHGALLAALAREKEAPDVVAAALAERGGVADVPAVLDAYRSASAHLRPQMEESLRELHAAERSPGLLGRDWRVRYRRRPRLGTFEPGWPGIAAIVHADPASWMDEPSPELRDLDAILAEPNADVCDCCGVVLQDPTGIPICPKSAVRAVSVQMALLEQELEEGVDELPDLLDEVEDRLWTIEARRTEREEEQGDGGEDEEQNAEADAASPSNGHRHGPGCSHDHEDEADDERSEEEVALDEAEQELEVLRATGEWLLEVGAEDVPSGIELLRAKAAELEALYGIDGSGPRRLKVGRNDACPCGSGKKFKKCCAP